MELPTITKPASSETLLPDVIKHELQPVKSVRDALAIAEKYPDKYPSLAKLRADHGSKKIEAAIKIYLLDLNKQVNLKRPLRPEQIECIASEILTEFYALTLADVHVIFRKARTGEYGEFYESLDTPKVMGWFRQYFSDRCSLGAQDSMNSQFSDRNDRRSSERMTQYFDKLERQFRNRNRYDK